MKYAGFECGIKEVLVFPTRKERDDYVEHDQWNGFPSKRISKRRAKKLMGDRKPVWDDGFGCMVVFANM